MFSCPCIIELQYRHIPLKTSLGFFLKKYLKAACILIPSYVSTIVGLPCLVLENNHKLSVYETLTARNKVIILEKYNQITKLVSTVSINQTYVIQVNYIKTRKLIIQLNYLMSCSV